MADELFEDDIKGRKPKEALLPKRVGDLHRNTRKLPEAVVKISSYSKDRGRALAHVNYISRRGKSDGDLPVEMADGSVLSEKDDLDEVINDWFARKPTRADARRTVNIVLSSPKNSNPEKVKKAVRGFAADFFGNHDYMFVIHTDTSNPHAHLTVKMRGFDGQQLRLNKPQLKAMRDLYAQQLRAQGIAVNAAHRTERGQWKKGQSRGNYYLDKKNTEPQTDPSLSRTIKEQGEHKDKPWLTAMLKKRKEMRAEYLGAAKYLRDKHGVTFEKQAKDLESYANDFPRPERYLEAKHRSTQSTVSMDLDPEIAGDKER